MDESLIEGETWLNQGFQKVSDQVTNSIVPLAIEDEEASEKKCENSISSYKKGRC